MPYARGTEPERRVRIMVECDRVTGKALAWSELDLDHGKPERPLF